MAVRNGALVIAIFAAFGGGAAACAWDWTVRDGEVTGADDASLDARVEGDATVTKDAASVDAANGADAEPSDANDSDDAPIALVDAGKDSAASDASVSCAALEGEADAARVAARDCTLGVATECAVGVTDLCGCTVFVADPDSGASRRFAMDSRELQMSGCTQSCTACASGPVRGSCLENAGGTACFP